MFLAPKNVFKGFLGEVPADGFAAKRREDDDAVEIALELAN